VQALHKNFDLSKIRAKLLTIWAIWDPTLFDFKKWHPTFPEKHMKTFFGGLTKIGLHDL